MTSLRRGSAIAECLLVALVTFVSPVFGQVPPPEAIHSPIRREWRGPIEKFLSEMTNQDPTHLVEKIVGFQIGAIWHPNSILFRVEDGSTCDGAVCFTAIGRIINDKFVPDVMFRAGKNFTQGDQFPVTAWFGSDSLEITPVETSKGWIVSAKGRR